MPKRSRLIFGSCFLLAGALAGCGGEAGNKIGNGQPTATGSDEASSTNTGTATSTSTSGVTTSTSVSTTSTSPSTATGTGGLGASCSPCDQAGACCQAVDPDAGGLCSAFSTAECNSLNDPTYASACQQFLDFESSSGFSACSIPTPTGTATSTSTSSSVAACSICDKAGACCQAIDPDAGGLCGTFSTAECNTIIGSDPTFATSCQDILTIGQDEGIAQCM